LAKKLMSTLLAAFALLTATADARAMDSLTYLYGGTTATYLNRMDKTFNNINIVSPDYFEVAADGAFMYTKTPDPLLTAMMHDRGVTVTPFFSNHWSRENARKMLARRGEVAAALAAAVTKHGLDGVDIDIQNINENDRDSFTDFIRLLRAALPQGKTLTVCVAANPYHTNVGWQGGYDYGALADECDHVFIMTYDESYDGGEPGPVASLWFVEESIKYALQHVPPEKLMVGIPFYGRFWKGAIKGAAWTCSDIESLAKSTNAVTWYDEAHECARATITVPEGETAMTWGGRIISSGVYDVWYENARSYEKKMSLVRKYGLKGVGSWALGQEADYVWGSYAAWLRGYPFDDIRDHWAQSYIVSLSESGVIKGKTDSVFDTEGHLTRAEAAAMLTRLAVGEPTTHAEDFKDTAGHWAAQYIAAARKLELVTGDETGMFRPDADVTREEFAVMADRYTNIEDSFDMTETQFSDVSPEGNPWSNSAIIKLCVNNVLNGYEGGAFRPSEPITRAEASKVLVLLKELPTRFVDGEVLPLRKGPISPR
jgi:spore germination protein YaaH